MLGDLAVRFVVGGAVVAAFAVLGDCLAPKRFAGLFAAAPSVGLATLALTYGSKGSGYAALEGRSMIAGAVALIRVFAGRESAAHVSSLASGGGQCDGVASLAGYRVWDLGRSPEMTSNDSRIRVDIGKVKETSWKGYAIRFLFGGVVTAFTGWVAAKSGPVVGGLFLAFPAILPASVTLVREHEDADAAGQDAYGAMLGSIGLAAFGAVIWERVRIRVVARAPTRARGLACRIADRVFRGSLAWWQCAHLGAALTPRALSRDSPSHSARAWNRPRSAPSPRPDAPARASRVARWPWRRAARSRCLAKQARRARLPRACATVRSSPQCQDSAARSPRRERRTHRPGHRATA